MELISNTLTMFGITVSVGLAVIILGVVVVAACFITWAILICLVMIILWLIDFIRDTLGLKDDQDE